MGSILDFLQTIPGDLPAGSSSHVSLPSGYSSATDPTLTAQLATLQKYDPNASIIQNVIQQGDSTVDAYNLSYDLSKLPATGINGPTARAPVPGGRSYNDLSMEQYNQGGGDVLWHALKNPSDVMSSIYGELTPESNVTTETTAGKTNWLDIVGPMLPMLFAGAMNPSMFSGMGSNLTSLLSHLGASEVNSPKG